MKIWVDKETGVNYVFHASGYAGGMIPLLDRDGKELKSKGFVMFLGLKADALNFPDIFGCARGIS